jgi:hypothetical protein
MGTGAMKYSNNVIEFKRPTRNTPSLFLDMQKAAIDVLCVGSAVLLVTTAAVGVAGIFFVMGTLVAFE